MGKYKDEVLDSLIRRAQDQIVTSFDRKVYASHNEMAAIKDAGAEIKDKTAYPGSPHFEAIFSEFHFVHDCSPQKRECAQGISLKEEHHDHS